MLDNIKDRKNCDIIPLRGYVNESDKNTLKDFFMIKYDLWDMLMNLEWDLKIKKETFYVAMKFGHLDIIKFYLHENGFVWNEYYCQITMEDGNLECLKYLHENGCPWKKNVVNMHQRMDI